MPAKPARIDRLQLTLPLFGVPLTVASPPPAPAWTVQARQPDAPRAPTTTLRTVATAVPPAQLTPPQHAPVAAPWSRSRALTDVIVAQLPRSKVVFTDNRSVLLSQQKNKQGVRVVRVHQMFLDAPTDVALATARFLVDGNRRDGRVVDAFIDAQAHLLALVARPFSPDAHRGRVHDLLPLYTHLNSKYFADRISAEMGWGQAPPAKRRARRSITFGSYDHRAKRIVMHPALDQPHVPSLVVARVLHHEMLHQLHGDERAPSGRRIVHGPRFRTDEARFDGAVAADAWLDRHLDGLLRYKAPGRLR